MKLVHKPNAAVAAADVVVVAVTAEDGAGMVAAAVEAAMEAVADAAGIAEIAETAGKQSFAG